MNWVRNNRFATGLLAVLILGVGGLGYLIYSSYSAYSEATDEFTAQSDELKRLEGLPVYPDASNQQKLVEQEKNHEQAVNALQTELAANCPPLETSLTATDFQKRLGDVAAEIAKVAAQNNVKLPTDFYLGFEQYKSAIPPADAVPLLAMELNSCQQIIRILLNHHIDEIVSFKRSPIPQEGGAAGGSARSRGGGRPGGGPGAEGEAAALLSVYPVDVEFRALPGSFRDSLNDIVQAPAFYIIRTLRVKNEQDKGPPRGADLAAAAAAGATPPAPAEATPPSPMKPGPPGVPEPPLPERPSLHYVVGTEHENDSMRIEIVRFKSPGER